jgi:hypothetical protein
MKRGDTVVVGGVFLVEHLHVSMFAKLQVCGILIRYHASISNT